MNNQNCLNTENMLSAAARILESRLYPPPPSCDELRSLYSVSDEYNQKILSLSYLIIARRSRTKTVRTVFIAAAIVTLLIVFAICMGASEGILFSMKTVDVHKADGTLNYTEIKNERNVITASDFEIVVFPKYIPEGFVRDVSFRSLTNEQRYINGEEYFVFTQSSLCSTTTFNSEKYQVCSVQIGENIAYYINVPKQNYTSIVMECRFGHISVYGTISIEECIKILENVAPM